MYKIEKLVLRLLLYLLVICSLLAAIYTILAAIYTIMIFFIEIKKILLLKN